MAREEQINTNSRERIAQLLTYLIPFSTIVLAIGAVIFAGFLFKGSQDKAIDVLKYTFASVLPLWATWLGTVLAYYFSKENFESANRHVKALVSQVTTVNEKLQSIKVIDVMIHNNGELLKENFKKEEELKKYEIKTAITLLEDAKKQRLPLFINNTLRYIIHLSIFDRYIRIQSDKGVDYQKHTIDNMASCDDFRIVNLLKFGAGFVAETSNLLEAKNIMDINTYCNDVFVTKNGKPEEEVLGWITDKIINEHAKV